MAATQNTLLSRLRSSRAPPASSSRKNDGLPLQGVSRGPIISDRPSVSLFLTNLHLLDLDLLPDWPDVNAQTFTGKDAAQGHKKRIQSVEWALYRLFVLWDPDEARNVRSSASSCLRSTPR